MSDEEAIRGVVLDYVDGWFDGDAVRWSGRFTRNW
jgi:hypothetical protein